MGANFWLAVPPNKSRGGASFSFRSLLRFHLSMPLLSEEVKCPDCGKAQDRFGIYALSCKVALGAIDKHDSIVNGIVECLRRAHINCSVEATNPNLDNRQRPGDIFVPDFDSHGDAYFDVSVINIVSATP